jgi:hypothetical protein
MIALIHKILGLFRAEEAKITAVVGGNISGAVAQATVNPPPTSVIETYMRLGLLGIQIIIGVLTVIYILKRIKSGRKGKDLMIIGGLAIALGFSGCMVPSQKGGHSSFSTPSGLSGGVQQSENPKSDTTQVLERVTREVKPDGVIVVTTEKLNTKIGSAQKDVAREMGAKLASLKGVVWVGIALFIFGAASAVYPPLKIIVGSLTTSVVCAVAGVALIILPSLIVGHEVLILSVGAGAVLVYWFAHHHGKLRGQLNSK